MLCIFASFSLKAQDPVYSQFYNAPLQLNPAFTGAAYGSFVAVNYRNQWPDLKAYETYSVSFDHYFPKLNSGFGLVALSDDSGDGTLKTTRFGGLYSYELKFGKDIQMKIGAEANIVQLRLDWDRLVFLDQLDRRYGATTPGGSTIPSQEIRPTNLSRRYIDISTGLLLYNPQFYVGLSLKHLNTPDQSFIDDNIAEDNLNIRMSLHGGYQIPLDYNKRKVSSFITPNVLLVRQGDFSQINVGAYVGLESFFFGAWYRHAGSNADALIASTGVKFGKFKLGYSYDYTVSELSNGTGGSHEFGLTMHLDDVYPKASKYNDCLSLFR